MYMLLPYFFPVFLRVLNLPRPRGLGVGGWGGGGGQGGGAVGQNIYHCSEMIDHSKLRRHEFLIWSSILHTSLQKKSYQCENIKLEE